MCLRAVPIVPERAELWQASITAMRQRANLDSTRQNLCAAKLRPISTQTRDPGRQIAKAFRSTKDQGASGQE